MFQNRTLKIFLVLALLIPNTLLAAAYESAVSDRSYWNTWSMQEIKSDGLMSLSVWLPGLKLNNFQENDTGTVEFTSTIVDPAHRRYAYISVRVDKNKEEGGAENGPFVSKIYRYDFESGKLTKLYNDMGGSGFIFLGFHRNKLLLVGAPAGDNSPGPCWYDEVLGGEKIDYLNVSKPKAGIQSFSPDKKFRALRAKSLSACEEHPFDN